MTKIVTRSEWLSARKDLLKDEKRATQLRDELAEKRRTLPMVRVEKEYTFQTSEGAVNLPDLFQGHSQLVIYHFMFGEDWTEGCPSCSYWADHFSRMVPHLKARDTQFACVSSAPLGTLLEYRKRMGWSFPWASSNGPEFGEDFGVFFRPDREYQQGYNYSGRNGSGEFPGISVFAQGDLGGDVLHSYSTYARGLEPLNATYGLLDMVPSGRAEGGEGYPMSWVRRHDQY